MKAYSIISMLKANMFEEMPQAYPDTDIVTLSRGKIVVNVGSRGLNVFSLETKEKLAEYRLSDIVVLYVFNDRMDPAKPTLNIMVGPDMYQYDITTGEDVTTPSDFDVPVEEPSDEDLEKIENEEEDQ